MKAAWSDTRSWASRASKTKSAQLGDCPRNISCGYFLFCFVEKKVVREKVEKHQQEKGIPALFPFSREWTTTSTFHYVSWWDGAPSLQYFPGGAGQSVHTRGCFRSCWTDMKCRGDLMIDTGEGPAAVAEGSWALPNCLGAECERLKARGVIVEGCD